MPFLEAEAEIVEIDLPGATLGDRRHREVCVLHGYGLLIFVFARKRGDLCGSIVAQRTSPRTTLNEVGGALTIDRAASSFCPNPTFRTQAY